MEFLLNRFRNLTVLLVVVMAQLMLLAIQVKGSQDARLIRLWSVTAVTPLAKVLEVVRRNTIGIVEDYFVLIKVREENRRLADELGKMKMENHFLKSELQTADRAQALRAFQARTPSSTIPARIIGTGTGANSRVVYVDRGSGAGIERGMAVVTPDGIVGKVLDSFPTASQVLLITDPTFAAGVISQKNRVHGTIKGLGQSKCLVDYVQNEENVEPGEMFYTSGDDRIFPKGMPVGRVTVARQGKTFKEIYVVPSGFQNGLEEVLIVVQGEHQAIPEQIETSSSTGMFMMNPPPATAAGEKANPGVVSTDADRMREQYKEVGEAQGHAFGEGGPGARPPNFNLRVEQPKAAAAPTGTGTQAGASTGAPSATGAITPPKTTPAPSTGAVPGTTTPRAAPPQTSASGQPVVSRPKPAVVATDAPRQGTTGGAATGVQRVGANGQPIVTRPKPAVVATDAPRQGTTGGAATGVQRVGADGQPVVSRPKPAVVATDAPRQGTTGGAATGVQRLGADGQPVVPRPKSPAVVTNGPASATSGGQRAGAEAQQVVRRPPPAVTTTGGAVSSGTSPAPRPAKPKADTAKPPATVGSGPARETQPQRRVITNDSTINVITPAPKSQSSGTQAVPRTTDNPPRPAGPPRTTGPLAPKPKPERSETSATP